MVSNCCSYNCNSLVSVNYESNVFIKSSKTLFPVTLVSSGFSMTVPQHKHARAHYMVNVWIVFESHVSRCVDVVWPARSPDLTAPDHFLW